MLIIIEFYYDVLQGNTSFKDITINNRDWYEENNIQLLGETVVKGDVENKIVSTDKKRERNI